MKIMSNSNIITLYKLSYTVFLMCLDIKKKHGDGVMEGVGMGVGGSNFVFLLLWD